MWATQPATDLSFIRGTNRRLLRVRSGGSHLVELTKAPVADDRASGEEGLLLVKRDAAAEPQRLPLEPVRAASKHDGRSINPPLGPRYGPMDAREAQLGAVNAHVGTLVARVELGLDNRPAVRDGENELVLLATNAGSWAWAGSPPGMAAVHPRDWP